jgi:hypothetical protein
MAEHGGQCLYVWRHGTRFIAGPAVIASPLGVTHHQCAVELFAAAVKSSRPENPDFIGHSIEVL